MYVRHKSSSRGWAYVGSHNLSESAWWVPLVSGTLEIELTQNRGRLTRDRTGKLKFIARNWECGVIVLATQSPSKDTTRGTRGAAEDLDIFRNSVPIPVELPALPYQGDERQPWFADEA